MASYWFEFTCKNQIKMKIKIRKQKDWRLEWEIRTSMDLLVVGLVTQTVNSLNIDGIEFHTKYVYVDGVAQDWWISIVDTLEIKCTTILTRLVMIYHTQK